MEKASTQQFTEVFYHLSKEQHKEVRKNCIETILHTDMMAHQAASVVTYLCISFD